MAVKQWAAGDLATAADMNAWTVPVYTYKTALTSRASNTTLTADPHLIAAMAANAMYDLIGMLDYEADATGDMKFQFTLPASATMNYAWTGYTPADSISVNGGNTASTVNQIGGGGAGVARSVLLLGNIVTSSTAGNLGINWAQNASVVTATIWHQYSYLKLERVG
jgi:hypothetical protein